MKKVAAEKRRYIDFSGAKRGPVIPPDPGKTKISIRLDNAVLDYFRDIVNKAGGGNYQTLINDALLEHIHRRSTLDVVKQAVREELAPYAARTATRGGAGRAAEGTHSNMRAAHIAMVALVDRFTVKDGPSGHGTDRRDEMPGRELLLAVFVMSSEYAIGLDLNVGVSQTFTAGRVSGWLC